MYLGGDGALQALWEGSIPSVSTNIVNLTEEGRTNP